MNLLPTLFTLLPPLWGVAVAADWLPAAMQEREESLLQLETARQQAEAELQSLGLAPSPNMDVADDSLPENHGNGAVAVADGGILFDARNSRLAYLDNVRVNHPLLQLKCRQRLYIQFPGNTLEDRQSQAKDAIKGSGRAASDAKGKSPAEASPSAPKAGNPPLCIEAGSGMVDGMGNRLYLLGSPGLSLQKGNNRACLAPAQHGTPARILADANGDILIEAGQLSLGWTDKEGRLNTLHHKGGIAYYRAENRTLLLQGATELTTPEGGISCSDELRLVLQLADSPAPPHGFMGQFAGLDIQGIEEGEATGQVRAFRPPRDKQPAAAVAGDRLCYNGRTGDCRVSGRQATLAYGENVLTTDDSIHLAPNGDVTLQGQHISGQYTRPGSGEGTEGKAPAPIQGQFETQGSIRFIAATGTVHFPEGIKAQDPLSSFHCGGSLELALLRDPQAIIPERESCGMLNLALAGYKDIERAHATGGVNLHYADAPGQEGLLLLADTADVDLSTGEATLTAAAGGQTIAQYKGNRLAAHSEGTSSTLHLATNGDLDMQGEEVSATLPLQGGQATARCKTRLHLTRESGRLEMGRGAYMESAEGILSSRGPLVLTLAPGDPAEARPAVPRYPQLSYNYSGLRYADTQEGGTMQTKQASLQCTGPIHVEMMPADQGKGDSPEGGIRTASAEGHVALAGKDASGRLITARGDKITFDGVTGVKKLTGKRVTLQDAHNTHIASGGGASIIIDRKNNARLTGAIQSTSATHIHEQIEQQQKTEER